ncbi:MAG: DNA polymerase/3'-5' exonuclease PolX [Candidatus Levyibacteriota bacterium]
MSNSQIAKLFRNVAAAYTIKDEKKFRFQIIAYQRAADAVEGSNSELKDLFKENKLDLLPGIGTSIKSHLEELFKTGKVKHFNWVFSGIPKSIFPLLDIPSFGPKKAYKLVKEFSLNNENTVIEDLKKIAVKGKIASLEGFGEKSQEDILQAINEYEMGKQKKSRMTLPYAFEIAEKIVDHLKTSKDVIEAYPLGSLRRMVETVGDIDIAVSTKKPAEVIAHFVSYPYKDRIIEKGPATASILVSGGKQVDLMTQPPESFGSLLQHFTGSKNHNIHLREQALKKGLSLSEYGIKKKNEGVKIQNFDSEEKFYKALGMDWIPPELREDTGEIELSLSHKLPNIVELPDIKGDLHVHSNFPIEPSHDLGLNSMEEMLKKAKELGYSYLGFSEHNPSVSKHTKKSICSILAKRKSKIEQINSSKKYIRAINLLEVDILANGELSIDDNCIDYLEGMIVAIHSSFTLSKSDMTKRVIKGLSNSKVKILAHPTGRLINQRPEIQLDWETIFEFCKKRKIALEINAWPYRLDLPDVLVRQAVDKGIKMIINTDSHRVSQMDLMKYGVSVARRGWAKKSDILNTLEYNEFIKWLKN